MQQITSSKDARRFLAAWSSQSLTAQRHAFTEALRGQRAAQGACEAAGDTEGAQRHAAAVRVLSEALHAVGGDPERAGAA